MVPRLLLPSFPITPPPSSCQAEEVRLSRHLICLVLSLAPWPQRDTQIHAPRIDLMSAAVWQWCMGRPSLVLVSKRKTDQTSHWNVCHTRWQDIQWAAWRTDAIWYSVSSSLLKVNTCSRRCLSAMMNWWSYLSMWWTGNPSHQTHSWLLKELYVSIFV